ncbi:hypothetical protein EII25_00860 [Erysipelotrichaceae bacterium OH741_COT-311]|nr:hypothetical protein EII25_00860 [Erysipelotrichaceae bacterium OH741_COT-311]
MKIKIKDLNFKEDVKKIEFGKPLIVTDEDELESYVIMAYDQYQHMENAVFDQVVAERFPINPEEINVIGAENLELTQEEFEELRNRLIEAIEAKLMPKINKGSLS